MLSLYLCKLVNLSNFDYLIWKNLNSNQKLYINVTKILEYEESDQLISTYWLPNPKVGYYYMSGGGLLAFVTIRNFFMFYGENEHRVSTKWLNLLRFFLRTFAHETQWVLRGFALFFLRNLRKTGNIFCESCAWNEILVLRNLRKTASFTQNVTF